MNSTVRNLHSIYYSIVISTFISIGLVGCAKSQSNESKTKNRSKLDYPTVNSYVQTQIQGLSQTKNLKSIPNGHYQLTTYEQKLTLISGIKATYTHQLHTHGEFHDQTFHPSLQDTHSITEENTGTENSYHSGTLPLRLPTLLVSSFPAGSVKFQNNLYYACEFSYRRATTESHYQWKWTPYPHQGYALFNILNENNLKKYESQPYYETVVNDFPLIDPGSSVFGWIHIPSEALDDVQVNLLYWSNHFMMNVAATYKRK